MLNAICAVLLSCKPAATNEASEAKTHADWSHVRLYGHAFSNEEFTEDEYQFIAEKMPIFTIEKRHAHKVHGPAKSEEATLISARKIKALNPDAKTLFYWNCDLIYAPLYESLKNLEEEQPTWVRESRFKKLKAVAKNGYNFAEQGAQDFWVKTASDIANDPAVGGVFVDASSKAALNGQLEIVHKLMDELPGLVLYNGYRIKPHDKTFYGGPETLKHADGVFVEAFLSGPAKTAEAASMLIDGLLEIPEDKHIICNGLIDGYGSNGSHEFSLAAYFIVANKNTYYRFGKGHHFNNEYMTYWHDDFAKKIGKPTGKASKEGLTYKRSFEFVDVTLDLENQKATLDWK